METRRPLIAEIKRNSLDDGPGIRSVVFFKGCPLSCVWCHNPECIRPGPELIYRAETCIGCKNCAKTCPEKAIDEKTGPASLDRGLCNLCGACLEECPSGALSMIGRYYEPDKLVEALARDKAFYDNSGGGVTLSGGEPTLFMDYAAGLAARLQERGIRVLLETCGDFDWERFQEKLMPHLDQVFIDLKICDGKLHQKFTGRDNARIKANLERLMKSGPPVLVRTPLIPEITATRENLEAIAAGLQERGISHIALLPYNPLWFAKARGLGADLEYQRETWMSKEEREAVKEIFAGFTLEREII